MRKKKIVLILTLLVLLPVLLFAAEESETISYKTDGLYYTFSTGVVSSGAGLGYRENRMEIGGNIASAALNTGVLCTFVGYPIAGLVAGGLMFGGVDVYARYDLIPHPRYNLSVGLGGNLSYLMIGASAFSTTAGLSVHGGYTTKNGTAFFFETNIPLVGYEYSRSCAPVLPDSEGESEPSAYEQQVTESSSFGWGFGVPENAYFPGAIMTTRFGVEIRF